MNEVRIIGGALRGRKIHFHAVDGLRPTLDRARETLFNWLMLKVPEAVCLDAFAGSGVLGFEALSRGSARVDFVEKNHAAVSALKRNQTQLAVAARSHILESSALQVLAAAPAYAYDLIFLDPPFASDLLQEALTLIATSSCLKPGGFVYFEAKKSLNLDWGAVWTEHRRKVMGEVQFGLIQQL